MEDSHVQLRYTSCQNTAVVKRIHTGLNLSIPTLAIQSLHQPQKFCEGRVWTGDSEFECWATFSIILLYNNCRCATTVKVKHAILHIIYQRIDVLLDVLKSLERSCGLDWRKTADRGM